MSSIKVLIAEDDRAYRDLLCDIVRKQGYTPVAVADGESALKVLESGVSFSLCILDVMMPKYDGWQVLEEVRSYGDVPVMMLTALGDEPYEIKGRLAGADDYVAKPFSLPLLISHIESLLRRAKKEQGEVLELGGIVLDSARRDAYADGCPLSLTNKEFQLLAYLMRNSGIVLSREKIIDHVWGFDYERDHRTVDAHVKLLRKKLGPHAKYVRTVRGGGYCFEV